MYGTPRVDSTFEPAHVSRRNARYGLRLFFVYLAFYALFMVLNAFHPKIMELVPAGGVNLAIWYGFGLIGAALGLALVYAVLCRSPANNRAGKSSEALGAEADG